MYAHTYTSIYLSMNLSIYPSIYGDIYLYAIYSSSSSQEPRTGWRSATTLPPLPSHPWPGAPPSPALGRLAPVELKAGILRRAEVKRGYGQSSLYVYIHVYTYINIYICTHVRMYILISIEYTYTYINLAIYLSNTYCRYQARAWIPTRLFT